MSDNDRHVVPHPDGGWDVKANDAERASSHHDTQTEAVTRAREIIGNAGGGELVTHGVDGRIRDSAAVSAMSHDHASAAPPASIGADGAAPTAATADTTNPGGSSASQAEPPPADKDAKPTLTEKVKGLFHRSSD